MEAATMVKRVINSVAYNTDTSELVAKAKGRDWSIYRTRAGAYFICFGSNEQDEIQPLERDRVRAIIANTDAEYRDGDFRVLDDEILSAIPGTNSGDTKESVIFLRVSSAMKKSIELVAKDSGQSVNSWLLLAAHDALQAYKARTGKNIMPIVAQLRTYDFGKGVVVTAPVILPDGRPVIAVTIDMDGTVTAWAITPEHGMDAWDATIAGNNSVVCGKLDKTYRGWMKAIRTPEQATK